MPLHCLPLSPVQNGGAMFHLLSQFLQKKNNAKKYKEFRTISLISHSAKILLRILNRRLYSKMEEQLEEEQFGFRKGKGTGDATGLLRTICERHLEKNKEMYVAFVDLEKTFADGDCDDYGGSVDGDDYCGSFDGDFYGGSVDDDYYGDDDSNGDSYDNDCDDGAYDSNDGDGEDKDGDDNDSEDCGDGRDVGGSDVGKDDYDSDDGDDDTGDNGGNDDAENDGSDDNNGDNDMTMMKRKEEKAEFEVTYIGTLIRGSPLGFIMLLVLETEPVLSGAETGWPICHVTDATYLSDLDILGYIGAQWAEACLSERSITRSRHHKAKPSQAKVPRLAVIQRQYRLQWQTHVKRMDRSRWPRKILSYVPRGRRNLGRPRKR
ncbi:hypothetical protein ANN_20938 [Periplaneta americana]|uniref:Reverse transcriptase domain-containing protein n=1 Tax=Periplaneta americana TaxID=6978 RepID=A0ABQ8SEN1_PERAM|nr:hypothetical protein ANN_20938 [Periplaneta americana]